MSLSLQAYAFSFLIIAFYWNGHRRNFRRIRRSDGVLTGLNFLVLGLITITPVVTRLFIDYGPRSDGLGIYVGLVFCIGAANALLWGYASIARDMMDPSVTARRRWVQFFIPLVLPGTMVTLSVQAASNPSRPWLWAAMAGVWLLTVLLRRWADRVPLSRAAGR
jgi:uncharacterized membrane protein